MRYTATRKEKKTKFHCAAWVDEDGRVVATARNTPWCCAERALLHNSPGKEDWVLVVVRLHVTRAGEATVRGSQPCATCRDALLSSRARAIVWSTDDEAQRFVGCVPSCVPVTSYRAWNSGQSAPWRDAATATRAARAESERALDAADARSLTQRRARVVSCALVRWLRPRAPAVGSWSRS